METTTSEATSLEGDLVAALEYLAAGYWLAMAEYMAPHLTYKHNPSTTHWVGRQVARVLIRTNLVSLAYVHGGVHKYYAISPKGEQRLAGVPDEQRKRQQPPRYVSAQEVEQVLRAAGLPIMALTDREAREGCLGICTLTGYTSLHYIAQGHQAYVHPADERDPGRYAAHQEALLQRAAQVLREAGLEVEAQQYAGEYAQRPGVEGVATIHLSVSYYQEVRA